MTIGWLVNLTVFLFSVLFVFLSVIYSVGPRLKGKPIFDILANSLAASVCYIVGWTALRGVNQVPIIPIVLIFLLMASTYSVTILDDLKADKRSGIKTTAVYFGSDSVINWGSAIYVLSFFLFLVNLVLNLSLSDLLLFPFLALGNLAFFKVYQSKKKSKIEKLVSVSSYSVLLATIILLIIYTSLRLIGITENVLIKLL